MGILKAVVGAIGGGLADSWLEVIGPGQMTETTAMVPGVPIKSDRSSNRKSSPNVISNGSIIHVGVNQMMILVDGGKIVDYSAEPGYYEVYLSSTPSMFNGELGDAVKETFKRIKFGGQTSGSQQVFYINLQEINGICYGTTNALQYYDASYDAELFLGCHGTYSVKITDPLKFYADTVPRSLSTFDFNEQNAVTNQLLGEFLTALQTAVGELSEQGVRIASLPAKGKKLAEHMSDVLDSSWSKRRGMEVVDVAIRSLTYNEKSMKIIEMRSQGRMMANPFDRDGYAQTTIAEGLAKGLEAAGSNENGAGATFMGMGMGMNAGGGFMNQNPATSAQAYQQQQMMQQMQQMQQQMAQMQQQNGMMPQGGAVQGNPQPGGMPQTAPPQQPASAPAPQAPASGAWACPLCGQSSTGNFCTNCGQKRPQPQPAPAQPAAQAPKPGWTCPSCGTDNTGRFCSGCGMQPPAKLCWTCPTCGTECIGGVCPGCGALKP